MLGVVSLREYLGDYIYKWVDDNLCSHYDSSFQYKLNEEVVVEENKSSRWGFQTGSGYLWMVRKENLLYATYSQRGKILECEWKEEDIEGISGRDIHIKKVFPVRVIESLEEL